MSRLEHNGDVKRGARLLQVALGGGAPPDPREAQTWLCDRTEAEAPRNYAQSRFLMAAQNKVVAETFSDRDAGIAPPRTLAPMPTAPSTLSVGGAGEAIEF